MNVYYDLSQSPPTHDFINFLVCEEKSFNQEAAHG